MQKTQRAQKKKKSNISKDIFVFRRKIIILILQKKKLYDC